MPQNSTVVDTFEVDDSLARELSGLLTKQTIREKVLAQLVADNNIAAYERMEENLIPITSKIEAIKVKITREFVPEKYRDPKYSWNYDGYDIDKNVFQILM